MSFFLGTAGFRLPLTLVLSATLTGTATYQVCPASAVPFASGFPSLDGSGPAQLSKSLARNPAQLLLMSWKCWPTLREKALTLVGLTQSEHEFWSHMNKGLHPGFIIHLLCDLHKLVNLLKPIGSAESGRNYLHLWEFGEI